MAGGTRGVEGAIPPKILADSEAKPVPSNHFVIKSFQAHATLLLTPVLLNTMTTQESGARLREPGKTLPSRGFTCLRI